MEGVGKKWLYKLTSKALLDQAKGKRNVIITPGKKAGRPRKRPCHWFLTELIRKKEPTWESVLSPGGKRKREKGTKGLAG